MILRILKNAIVKWWKNINLTIVASLISSINPVFLFMFIYSNNIIFDNYKLLKQNFFPVIFFYLFLLSIVNFFPTTFTITLFQRRIIDNNNLNLKDFLSGFWKKLLQTILPWLGLTLFFGITSILIIFTGSFYEQMFPNSMFKILILLFIFFIFSIFISTQYVFFPLYVYEEEKIKISNAIKFAMEITLRNPHIVIPLFIIDASILLFLMFLPYVNILFITTFYYGISNIFKLYLYHELIKKYTEPKKYKNQMTKVGNSPSPWLELLQSKKEIIKNRGEK
ncbi:MAG: hypothetical protein N2258_03540 [Brevinematales bacterium]|nr:hypothetical protein [Brevinematales bacterium]